MQSPAKSHQVVDIDKLILKFICRGKSARIANNTEEEHSGKIDTTWLQGLL